MALKEGIVIKKYKLNFIIPLLLIVSITITLIIVNKDNNPKETTVNTTTTIAQTQATKKVKSTKQTTTVKQTTQSTTQETTQENKQEYSEALYSASYFKTWGELYWNNWTWKYYSEKVLPGEGLSIPGRHADKNGYICDQYDNICLASEALPYGTEVPTPLGKQGKVYDSGCSYDVLDVYVNW